MKEVLLFFGYITWTLPFYLIFGYLIWGNIQAWKEEKMNYRILGEGFTMQCKEQDLLRDLVEAYSYYYKIAQTEGPDGTRAEGAVEALSAIMLKVFGGPAFYKIWESTMEWASKGE